MMRTNILQYILICALTIFSSCDRNAHELENSSKQGYDGKTIMINGTIMVLNPDGSLPLDPGEGKQEIVIFNDVEGLEKHIIKPEDGQDGEEGKEGNISVTLPVSEDGFIPAEHKILFSGSGVYDPEVDTEFPTIEIKQISRILNFEINFTDGMPSESDMADMKAVMTGVSQGWDLSNDKPYGDAVKVAPVFTIEGGMLKGSVTLLGIVEDGSQVLTFTTSKVRFVVDMTEELIDFNDNKSEPFLYKGKVTLTTAPKLTVTTSEPTNIYNGINVTFSGGVTSDDNSSITEVGFVYSAINTNPEIDGTDVTKVVSTLNTNAFTENDMGLKTESSKYYVCAYAINAGGTVYGVVKTFTTEVMAYYSDGLFYQWGSKNAWKGNRNSNGTDMPPTPVGHSNSWNPNHNPADNAWNTGTEDAPVKTANDPCPDGWRVPTNTENKALYADAGNKIADAKGEVGYFWDDTAKTGTLTFTNRERPSLTLPAAGDLEDIDGSTNNVGMHGMYWASTYGSSGWAMHIGWTIGVIYPSAEATVACGFAVRCVQE